MHSQPYTILYLSSFGTLERGGQNSLLELVTRLNRKVFKPIVMVPEKGALSETLNDKGVETIVQYFPPIIRSNPVAVISSILKLSKIISQNKVCLIHSDNVRNTFYGGVVSKARGIPLVWHIRVNEGNCLIDKLLSRFVHMIITVSMEGRKRFSWVDEDKIITIYNAVDLKKFNPEVLPAEIEALEQKKNDDILIGEIGEVTPRKAQEDLIRAVGLVYKKYKDVRLILVGRKDEEYYRQLMHLINVLNLGDRVLFLDYRDDTPRIISLLDVVVLPSLLEGLPRVILEAMSSAKPVIASDISGNNELIIDGETGYLFPVKDYKMLAKKLECLIKNKKKRIDMGERGRRRALEYFDIEKQVVKIESLYTDLIAGNRV